MQKSKQNTRELRITKLICSSCDILWYRYLASIKDLTKKTMKRGNRNQAERKKKSSKNHLWKGKISIRPWPHNLNALILEEDLNCQASRQSFTPCSNLSSEDIVFMSASATFCLPKTEGMMGGRVRKLSGGMLNGLVYAIQLHLTSIIDCHDSKIQRNEERVLRTKLVDKRFHQIKMLTNKVCNPASKKNQC